MLENVIAIIYYFTNTYYVNNDADQNIMNVEVLGMRGLQDG